MVIIRFSMDRTRWDSIKLTTVLNFVPETHHCGASLGTESKAASSSGGVELESALCTCPSMPSDAHLQSKLTLASHVRSSSGGGLGLDARSVFSVSRPSLHDSFV